MAIHKFRMLYKDLADNLGEDGALALFPEYPLLPGKMNAPDQAVLARRVMDRMDSSLDRETIVKIRRGHSCNLPKDQKRGMTGLMERCADVHEFLTAYGCTRQEDGTYLTNFTPMKCWCSLFNKLDNYKPISITWCECCNGHTEKGLREVCGQPVKTEIIESIASGGKSCVYRITVS